MIGGIAVLLITGLISFAVIDRLKARFPFIDASLLKNLFFYHSLLLLAYYGYASFNSSDSSYYYEKIIVNYRGPTWFDFFGTSTTFIEFVGYPFIKFFGFSYEAMMALFSFLGFLGFVYFYIFFRENIKFKHTLFGYDLLKIIFFLPNLHFWSTSFGKGSIIFFGIGLFFFGINDIKKRLLSVVIGGLIIYYVRPHIMLVILISTMTGFVFSTKGVSIAWRGLFLVGASLAFFFIYRDVLTMVGIDENEFMSQGLDLSHRASELKKATSGVDISTYSLPFQVFTFLFRPLFIDATGVLGLLVSFENVFYLLITVKMFSSLKGLKFLFTGSFISKSAFLSFMTISIALAQVSGNLGLAMRQKSQVMILFLFVIISFFDSEKMKVYRSRLIQQMRRDRFSKLKSQQAEV